MIERPLTVEDLALRYKVTVKTIYEWMKKKEGFPKGFTNSASGKGIRYFRVGDIENYERESSIQNSAQKEIDIAPCRESDLMFKKSDVITEIDREIAKAKETVRDLQRKKDYSVANFGEHFEKEFVGQ